jgi:hypothetical protein
MKKKHRYWTDWVRLQSNRQLLAKYDGVFEVQERQGYSRNLGRRIDVLTEEIYRRGNPRPPMGRRANAGGEIARQRTNGPTEIREQRLMYMWRSTRS